MIDVVRKNIKNIHLWVYPPYGNIRIACPHHIEDEALRLMVISKLSWIKKQVKNFLSQDRQTPREYVSGESHYYLWQRYLLNIIEDKKKRWVKIRNKKYIDLYAPIWSTLEKRKKILDSWMRKQLKKKTEKILLDLKEKTWLEVNDYKIRVMKTKWWSCNIEAKRILINFELIKKNKKHLEYIILHELIHLLERHHNDNFRFYLDKYMPNWKEIKRSLNESILTI